MSCSLVQQLLTVSVTVLLLWSHLSPTRMTVFGLQCPGCGHRSDCPSVVDCPGGTTSDPCGCCLECAKVINETCGGAFRSEGKCDEGLVCVIAPVPGAVITGEEIGTCKAIPAHSTSVTPQKVVGATNQQHDTSCNAVDCDDTAGPDSQLPVCPPDSVPAPRLLTSTINDSTSHVGPCCPVPPPPLTCRCLPCDPPQSSLPMCGPRHIRVLRTEGSQGTPGQCCDVYECVEHAKFCDDVECGFDDVTNDDVSVTCPEDSYRPPTLLTQDGCCLVGQGCRCKGAESCVDVTCPAGQQKRLRQLATGLPGSCCNTYDCINGSNVVCYHNGTQRVDGETWQADDCTRCVCQDGLSFCEPVHCPPVTQCGWISRPVDSCCPVCKGCVSQAGELQESGTTWQQDNCVTCRCDEGQIYCQAQMCSIGCINPRLVSGECCPVCDDTLVITLAPHCPSLSNCTLMCSDGYVRSINGCYQCQCVEFNEDPCDLDCPNGYRRDILGFEVCDCADNPFAVSTRHQQPHPTTTLNIDRFPSVVDPVASCSPMIGCSKQCLYGYRTDQFGCPRCRCNRCPPFDCTKKCRDGFAHGADGCKLCRCLDLTFVEPTVKVPALASRPTFPINSGRQCISTDGQRTIEDGQSWWDGCRRCFCREGHEMCALISCPILRCINPVIRLDSCCPSCPGDVSLLPFVTTNLCHLGNGRYYADGDTWQLDDCTLCICHQGTPLCIVDSCPPTLCHHPVVLPRLCCPVCPDNDGFLPTSALVPRQSSQKPCRSVLTGKRYASGDTWRVDACQSCTCQDGQILCFAQTCPILSCNRSVLKKGHCCPICTAGLGSSIEFCSYAGDIYSVGETWLVDDCTHCTCADGGQVLCTITVCDVHSKCTHSEDNSRALFGVCCPVCHNDTHGNSLMSQNLTGDASDNSSTSSSLSTINIILILFVILLTFVVLFLLSLLFSRRLRHIVYHHRTSVVKSSAPSTPLAPPRYAVASSQLSSVIDCADLDLQRHWVSGLANSTPLTAGDGAEEVEEGTCGATLGSDDSLHKPAIADTSIAAITCLLQDDAAVAAAAAVDADSDGSCERLSSVDCDTVDDDSVDDDVDEEHEDQTRHSLSQDHEGTGTVDRLLGPTQPCWRNSGDSVNRGSW